MGCTHFLSYLVVWFRLWAKACESNKMLRTPSCMWEFLFVWKDKLWMHRLPLHMIPGVASVCCIWATRNCNQLVEISKKSGLNMLWIIWHSPRMSQITSFCWPSLPRPSIMPTNTIIVVLSAQVHNWPSSRDHQHYRSISVQKVKAAMPRCWDLAIFVVTTTTMTDRLITLPLEFRMRVG